MPTEHKEYRARLRQAINHLVECSIEDANKGGGHPDDVPTIEADLASAKKRLTKLLDELPLSW